MTKGFIVFAWLETDHAENGMQWTQKCLRGVDNFIGKMIFVVDDLLP